MTSGETIHVITLADDNYAMPLAVMGRSLFENYRGPDLLHLKIIDGGISAANRRLLEKSWSAARAVRPSWEFVAPSFGTANSLPVWGRVPKLTYARLALNHYYTPEVERAVVLDSDTLILSDIGRLHAQTLDDSVLGACVDPFITHVAAVNGLAGWRRLGLPADAAYFNAGIMVVALHQWARHRITERALDYIRERRGRLHQYDQDGLNAVLAGCWRRLDSRWHVHPRTPNSIGGPAPAQAWIVHFSGRLKPWLYSSRKPLDSLYFEYLDRTAWSGSRPAPGLRNLACRIYDSPLRRALYPIELRVLALGRSLEQKLF